METEAPVRFESATERDATGITELMQRYYKDEQYPFNAAVALGAIRGLLQDANKGRIWVARLGKEMVGYIVLTYGYSLEYGGVDAFIDDLYLIPEVRGRGLGKRALTLAESACKEAGVKALHLEVETYKDSAKKLYKKAGFAESDRKLMTKKIHP